MNSLDEFFKSKLEDHSVAPSAQAWLKVQGLLSKKNRTIVWFRIAACLALTSLGWFAFHYSQPVSVEKLTVIPSPIEKVELPVVKERIKKHVIKDSQAQRLTTVKAAKKIQHDEPIVESEKLPVEKLVASVTIETKIIEPKISEPIIETKEVVTKAEKPLVIEYTLESVVQVTPEVASRSKLQRVLDFALDAKHSDGALTNLRQAKDDLFALNFIKDKTKNSKN